MSTRSRLDEIEDLDFAINKIVHRGKTYEEVAELLKKRGANNEQIKDILSSIDEEYQGVRRFESGKFVRAGNFFIDIIFLIGILLLDITSFSKGDNSGYHILGLLVFGLTYFLLPETLWGVTIGKLITGSIVVNEYGKTPSFFQTLIRTLCRLMPSDKFSIFSSGRVFHDRISNTFVISRKRWKFFCSTHALNKQNIHSEARPFVEQLEKLGYFKYADQADLNTLKEEMISNFDPNYNLPLLYLEEGTFTTKDYRNHFCDGESVYESGGIPDMLEDLKPSFQRIGLKIEISNYKEDWDEKNNSLNESITINGREYCIFRNFKETGWGEAPLRLAEILNSEFEKLGTNERVYLASGGNDGFLLILTNELFEFIYSTLKEDYWKPLRLDEWAKIHKVEPMNIQ